MSRAAHTATGMNNADEKAHTEPRRLGRTSSSEQACTAADTTQITPLGVGLQDGIAHHAGGWLLRPVTFIPVLSSDA